MFVARIESRHPRSCWPSGTQHLLRSSRSRRGRRSSRRLREHHQRHARFLGRDGFHLLSLVSSVPDAGRHPVVGGLPSEEGVVVFPQVTAFRRSGQRRKCFASCSSLTCMANGQSRSISGSGIASSSSSDSGFSGGSSSSSPDQVDLRRLGQLLDLGGRPGDHLPAVRPSWLLPLRALPTCRRVRQRRPAGAACTRCTGRSPADPASGRRSARSPCGPSPPAPRGGR